MAGDLELKVITKLVTRERKKKKKKRETKKKHELLVQVPLIGLNPPSSVQNRKGLPPNPGSQVPPNQSKWRREMNLPFLRFKKKEEKKKPALTNGFTRDNFGPVGICFRDGNTKQG